MRIQSQRNDYKIMSQRLIKMIAHKETQNLIYEIRERRRQKLYLIGGIACLLASVVLN